MVCIRAPCVCPTEPRGSFFSHTLYLHIRQYIYIYIYEYYCSFIHIMCILLGSRDRYHNNNIINVVKHLNRFWNITYYACIKIMLYILYHMRAHRQCTYYTLCSYGKNVILLFTSKNIYHLDGQYLLQT